MKVEVVYVEYEFDGGNVIDITSKHEFKRQLADSAEGKPFYIFFYKKMDKVSHEMFKIYCQYSAQYNKKFIFGKADVESIDYFDYAMVDQPSTFEFPVIQSYNFGELISGFCSGLNKDTFDEMISNSLDACEAK